MAPLSFLVPLYHFHLALKPKSGPMRVMDSSFVHWIGFHNSTGTERNSTKGAVRCGQSSKPFTMSFKILANESRYRNIHSLDRLVNVRKSVEIFFDAKHKYSVFSFIQTSSTSSSIFYFLLLGTFLFLLQYYFEF